MGYYLGNRGAPSGALEGMFTAREYCLTLETVERQFVGSQVNDPRAAWRGRCQPAFDCIKIGNFSAAVRLLRELLRRHPQNWRLHQLIGLARFFQGRLPAAQKHLELARRLLRRERTASGSLQHALHVHLEGAFLRYALLCVYLRLGRSQDARALVAQEGQDL
jgi:tetratricopeptide (TPR) repeat protein